jgi:hypothetical protein
MVRTPSRPSTVCSTPSRCSALARPLWKSGARRSSPLVGILEERRPLLKAKLVTEDERALFRIANEFAVRHRRANQRSDYADVYLDWLFWLYLATVYLTDQLLARQAVAQTGSGSPKSPLSPSH